MSESVFKRRGAAQGGLMYKEKENKGHEGLGTGVNQTVGPISENVSMPHSFLRSTLWPGIPKLDSVTLLTRST